MRRRTIWIILGLVVAAAVVAGVAIALANSGAPSDESETASPSPSATQEATSPPAPAPSSPESPTASATCDDIATDEWLANADEMGWVSLETQDLEVGAQPFADFPGGAPADQLVCRWAADPEAPTDSVIDFAWTPSDPTLTEDAQLVLIDAGYSRTEGPDGALFELGPGGDAYLFTGPDVRWAMTADQLSFVKAPGE